LIPGNIKRKLPAINELDYSHPEIQIVMLEKS